MIEPQEKVLEILSNKLNEDYDIDKFVIGKFTVDKNNSFIFLTQDTNNKYNFIENDVIPCMFDSYLGEVETNKNIYSETGTIEMQVAIPIDGNYVDRKKDFFNFKRNIIEYQEPYNDDTTGDTILATDIEDGQRVEILSLGDTDFTTIGADKNEVGETFTATGSATGTGTVKEVITYYTLFNSSPITTQGKDLLNSKRVLVLTMSIFYGVSTVKYNNDNFYEIKKEGEEDTEYIILNEIDRGIGKTSNLTTTSQNTIPEGSFIPGTTVWFKDSTIYVEENNFVNNLLSVIEDENQTLKQRYILRQNLFGRDSVIRTVIIDKVTLPDKKGRKATISVSFKKPNE